ncbi:ECF transporter S component [Thermosediminibacter litoriperuensis]|uniref:Putative membrane protein n=1 Tax=Thermosediminibacter litoriperuensis TaxID=291989 RepID=A0A5S5AFS2_9FIRM|nr:ECF transporter S component [Thermosediminibacter litoriperuensis]TYP48168.1 putative membrane protein [Thermosediminibacter litoriperuensis]
MNESIKKLAFMSLFMALLVIATAILSFPVPNFNLYFNLGESVIYLVALIYGGIPAAIIGGVGSALADILKGYPVWAPITFFIKGIEGFIAGTFARRSKPYTGVVLGAAFMMTGYAIAAWRLYGIGAVPVELAGDFMQVSVGAIIALFLHRRLKNLSFDDQDKF